ncbi:MAG: hypothetical protein JWM59_3211 [Verrucomicrobiales bacterium]|nr:hypothetical protein [Verrucomicrobiales bacterium]
MTGLKGRGQGVSTVRTNNLYLTAGTQVMKVVWVSIRRRIKGGPLVSGDMADYGESG